MSTEKAERNKIIYELRKNGNTLEAIGKQFGITKERVRQIYLKQERRARWKQKMNSESEKE